MKCCCLALYGTTTVGASSSDMCLDTSPLSWMRIDVQPQVAHGERRRRGTHVRIPSAHNAEVTVHLAIAAGVQAEVDQVTAPLVVILGEPALQEPTQNLYVDASAGQVRPDRAALGVRQIEERVIAGQQPLPDRLTRQRR